MWNTVVISQLMLHSLWASCFCVSREKKEGFHFGELNKEAEKGLSFPNFFWNGKIIKPFALRPTIHHTSESYFYHVRRVLYSTSPKALVLCRGADVESCAYIKLYRIALIHSMPVLRSYRNLSTDLPRKSFDWLLYEGNTGT